MSCAFSFNPFDLSTGKLVATGGAAAAAGSSVRLPSVNLS